MRFIDREEAGEKLAAALSEYKGKEGIVYALPRGGVVLGLEVAKAVDMPLDLLIPRKVGYPANPEFAVCAVTESGHEICKEELFPSIDSDWLRDEIENQKKEAKRRREVYLKNRERYDVKGKIAIIVDDGIATGLTMLAAIAEAKDKNPSEIVVAIPVLPSDTAQELSNHVDKVVALSIPDRYMGAVGAYYDNFEQVNDEEVLELLDYKVASN